MITSYSTATPWSFMEKLLLRFFLLVFLLYIFFNPNGVLPYLDVAFEVYIQPFHTLMAWIGKNVLHIGYPITTFTNGSGDTTYDYVVVFFIVAVAVIASIIWTVVDRKPRSQQKLFYWLCVIIRYYVVFTMLAYGLVKVIKLQFPYPDLRRLMQPYGESSPMGLAWTFMGFSKGYNMFMGLAEITTGVLLMFRRTTTLGALIGLCVSANIMAVNYFFDVPVKLLSTMLVIMCLFLLAKEARRLLSFFILNEPVAPSNISAPKFRKRWQNITLIVIKYGMLLYVLIANCFALVEAQEQYGDAAPKPPLYGVYTVESFVRNSDTLSPLTTDTSRWNRLIINYAGSANVRTMNDSSRRFVFNTDTLKQRIEFFSNVDTTYKTSFNYNRQNDQLIMRGKWKDDSLQIFMRRMDEKNFLLVNRGFHWINEFPFNR